MYEGYVVLKTIVTIPVIMLVLNHVNAQIKFEKDGRYRWRLGYRSQLLAMGLGRRFRLM